MEDLNMNGGYLIVSLQNHDFVVDGGRVYVKDIYKTIANSNYKAVMLCDITLNGEHKQNVYSVIERGENSVTLYAYGNAITITDADTIEITDYIVTNIRYYDSLDQVPADLPEGSFVTVPAEESAGGGGLPVVEISNTLAEGSSSLSETDTDKIGRVGISPFILTGNIMMVSGVERFAVVMYALTGNTALPDSMLYFSSFYFEQLGRVEVYMTYAPTQLGNVQVKLIVTPNT